MKIPELAHFPHFFFRSNEKLAIDSDSKLTNKYIKIQLNFKELKLRCNKLMVWFPSVDMRVCYVMYY